jgi:hypothetical protein
VVSERVDKKLQQFEVYFRGHLGGSSVLNPRFLVPKIVLDYSQKGYKIALRKDAKDTPKKFIAPKQSQSKHLVTLPVKSIPQKSIIPFKLGIIKYNLIIVLIFCT